MTVNVGKFELEISKKIAATTDSKELLMLTNALKQIKSGTVDYVANYASLPTASCYRGKMFYVDSECLVYWSTGSSWVSVKNSNYVGQVWGFGNNSQGRLGTGNTTCYSSPVTTVTGGTNWCQISAGCLHSAAVKTDGTLWTWGNNSCGVLGTGNTTSGSSPVTTAGGGTNWCYVAGGYTNTASIKTDGTLWVWGNNTYGQLGTGNTTNYSSPVTTAGGGTNWWRVSFGNQIAHAIKTDGTLWTWGREFSGSLGNGVANGVYYSSPATTAGGGANWCQASAGFLYGFGIKTDGTLWTWGRNNIGQLGTGNTTCYSSPVTTVTGGTTWCQVSGGYTSTASIKTDGTLWVWGENSVGQLGTGNTTHYSSPVTTAGGGTNWCQVSIGKCHTVGVKTDGTLWTWGCGGYGALGTGNTTNYSSPVTTLTVGIAWKMSCVGVQHTIGLAAATY